MNKRSILVTALAVAPALAHADAPPAVPTAAPVAASPASAAELLAQITAASDGATRLALAKQLQVIAPTSVATLATYLARDHANKLDARRAVLKAIKAQIPDKTGKFATPDRKKAAEARADEEIDWLADIATLDGSLAATGEVFADIAALHALASSNDVQAAQIIFDAAFDDSTVIYRDDCGRQLRRMGAYSIPALTRESQGKNSDRKRYASYQLERQDRQDPAKALAAATGDDELSIAILDAFRETHHREAVHAVWDAVDVTSPRVRAAARATWMAYITGNAPPPAPKKKLTMSGGRVANKETPLWLTYRELADEKLRVKSSEILDEEIPEDAAVDRENITKRLFEHFDAERHKRDSAQWAAAKAKADGGDLTGAATLLDRLVADDPAPTEAAAMASIYFAQGAQLEKAGTWDAAAIAYSKAAGLDPKGPKANDALAAHYFMLGKSLEAAHQDGGAAFRKAVALRPDYAPAKAAAVAVDKPGKPTWMLLAAGGAVLLAAIAFLIGMLKRRAV